MAQSLALSGSTQNSKKLTWLHPNIGIVVLSWRSSFVGVHRLAHLPKQHSIY